jgi:hypothetical protein
MPKFTAWTFCVLFVIKEFEVLFKGGIKDEE